MLSINEIEQIKEQAYVCSPSVLQGVCQVYPYTIRQIIEMGSINYYSALGTLLLTLDEIKDLVKKKSKGQIETKEIEDVFTYLIQSAASNDIFLLELQNDFFTFIKEEILILPELNVVVVGNPAEKRFITKENFYDFQNILKIQHRKEIEKPPPPDETPGERKMRLLREKTARVKKKQAEKKGETQSFVESMEIAETFGISLDHSVYSFYGLLKRHQYREKWNNDIQLLCAGADSKNIKTKYWGESLDNE